MSKALRPVGWIGSSKKDLTEFPESVQGEVGYALYLAQLGGKSDRAKPLKGFSGAGILEVVVDHIGDTYRAVYTVRFEEAVYVLHTFQKKSKRGKETPQTDINLIKERLKRAEQYHQEWLQKRGKSSE
jgi:phage-related protein